MAPFESRTWVRIWTSIVTKTYSANSSINLKLIAIIVKQSKKSIDKKTNFFQTCMTKKTNSNFRKNSFDILIICKYFWLVHRSYAWKAMAKFWKWRGWVLFYLCPLLASQFEIIYIYSKQKFFILWTEMKLR